MRSPCYTPYSNVRRKVIACLFAKYSLEMPTAIPASVADSLNPKTFVIQILFDPGQDIFMTLDMILLFTISICWSEVACAI